MHILGAFSHLFALRTANLRALFTHRDAKPLEFALRLCSRGLGAAQVDLRVRSKDTARPIRSLGDRLCRGCGRLGWERGRTQLPKISEVTCSVKQVE